MIAETILGIDPGYDRLGWAVGTPKGREWQSLHYGTIHTNAQQSLPERYADLAQQLRALIQTHQPAVVAIESLFFAKNQKTALKVSEARGVILQTCLAEGLRVQEFTPPQVKQALTGYGRADKKGVEKMVRMELKLGSQPIGDDAIDALAVMLTGRFRPTFDEKPR